MGVPPHDEQVPALEENTNVDQAPANHPPMMEAKMRDILAQMSQAMTTQAQSAMVQAQAMTSQANRDIAPCPYEKFTTMASRVRDFTQINPHIFMGLRLMKTPKNSSMRSKRYYMLWGCLQVRRPSCLHIKSRIWLKLGMCNGGIMGH